MKRITLLFGAILLCVGTFAQLGYYYNEEFVELETNDKAPYLVITYNEESRNVIESKLADQASIENTNPTCRRISKNRYILDSKDYISIEDYVSEMEKMYAQYEPEPPMSYEQFLQRYQDKLFDQFGTDEQRYFDYYDQNLDYFYGGQGSYELTIDEDCKQLGIAVGDKRLLDKAISLWEEGSKAQASIPAGQLTNPQHQDKIDMAKRLLYRYTLLRFATPQEWRSWYRTYGDRLFWTESGGWLFMVNTEDPNIPGNDYAIIGK